MSKASPSLPPVGPCTLEQITAPNAHIAHDEQVRACFAAGQRVRNRWTRTRRLGTIEMVSAAAPTPGGSPSAGWSRALINWEPSRTTDIDRTEVWLGDLVLVDAEGADLAEQPPLPPGERAPGAPE